MSNIIIGLPSGRVLNCNSECKYILFTMGLAKKFPHFEGKELEEYAYLDSNYIKVKRAIKQTYKMGTKFYHSKYGIGEIGGVFGDDGWIIDFSKEEKKMYVDNSMLMQDLRFEML